ncbi:MAG: asparagine synthetase B family protein [Planctomycetales bacterium]|nr:asparagine synthetase B family protein [Planctomycetales bacterium]
MTPQQPIERIIDLIDPAGNILLNMDTEAAYQRVLSGDPERVAEIDGQFAIATRNGIVIRMARSIGRPMRYFLAKRSAGPCLIIAERIDQIRDALRKEGLENQFHPSYTRMVPAHHVVELQLVGCPDPNPKCLRYFNPIRNRLPADIGQIGHQYVSALAHECHLWLEQLDSQDPIGVLFSGGIDSGSVLVTLYQLLLRRGQSPSRLKAFTLDLDGQSPDARQAREFLKQLQMEMFLEIFEVPSANIDWKKTIQIIEDYKALDVQAATMGHALCSAIREQYPEWRWLVDGDGGDENLKDYPIEDNPELTIRSVLNNLMLYQEGWGVDAIKHSLVYSGGQSRGHVRSFAPGSLLGFKGFSPYALPRVIQVAEGIPYVELTDWQHDRLYSLKGQIISAGMKSVFDVDFPIYEKRRFQHGATTEETFAKIFPANPDDYRDEFHKSYALGL